MTPLKLWRQRQISATALHFSEISSNAVRGERREGEVVFLSLFWSPWTDYKELLWCRRQSAGTSEKNYHFTPQCGLKDRQHVTSLNLSVMREMFGALSFLSGLFQAWPRNSLKLKYRDSWYQIFIRLGSTDWLQMEKSICWSRNVISSAISSALSVEMFSVEGATGGFSSSLRLSLLVAPSSFFSSRSSCVAALCSAGSRLELQTMSSRKRVVRYLRREPSKSWLCLVIQCLSTESTLIVAAEWVMDILRFADSLKDSLSDCWSLSRGLWDPAVAAANACAALLELDLEVNTDGISLKMCFGGYFYIFWWFWGRGKPLVF